MRIFANPFFVYIVGFAMALLIYSFGWSTLYPDLSAPLLAFFVVTFAVSLLMGIAVLVLGRIEYKPITWNDKSPFYIFLIWVGYTIEFFYNHGIPIFMLGSSSENRIEFGIPTFHVILVTIGSFFSVYLFHQLCSDFRKSRLLYFLLSILPAILVINRGMLFMILSSSLFVFLLSLRGIRVRTIVGTVLTVLVAFYFFGLVGNLRQTHGKTTTSEYILSNGQATPGFKDSIIPPAYFWTYLYASSPLANLQFTVDNAEPLEDWVSFFNFELIPDFISKRTAPLLDAKKTDVVRIAPWLTVSTLYARSYVFVGWMGMVILFIVFTVSSFFYLLLLPKRSEYYVTGLAILCTVALFNTFDNMYSFTGLQFQLIYPLIFSYIKFPIITIRIPASNG
ncbi:MAG: hypothetical protein ABIS12_09275 [Bacteroidia bacterium]